MGWSGSESVGRPTDNKSGDFRWKIGCYSGSDFQTLHLKKVGLTSFNVWITQRFECRFLKACFKVAFLYALCRQLCSEHFHPPGSFLPGLQSLFTLLIYANTDMYVNLLCITVYSEIINRLFCHLNNKLLMMFIFLILCTLHIYGTV